MQPPGTFKIHSKRRPAEPGYLALHPLEFRNSRAQRIIDSLREQILEGGGSLRIRRIFEEPREIYRIELDVPGFKYQRTTLLDGDALEELLEIEEVRSRVAEALC